MKCNRDSGMRALFEEKWVCKWCYATLKANRDREYYRKLARKES